MPVGIPTEPGFVDRGGVGRCSRRYRDVHALEVADLGYAPVRDRSVGIVLSGTDHDGTFRVREAKAHTAWIDGDPDAVITVFDGPTLVCADSGHANSSWFSALESQVGQIKYFPINDPAQMILTGGKEKYAIIGFIPLPNIPNAPYGQNNYTKAQVRERTTDGVDLKVNHTLNQRDQMSYRFNFMRPVVFDPGLHGQYGGPANGGFALGCAKGIRSRSASSYLPVRARLTTQPCIRLLACAMASASDAFNETEVPAPVRAPAVAGDGLGLSSRTLLARSGASACATHSVETIQSVVERPITAAVGLIDVGAVRRLFRVRRSEFVLWLAAFGGVAARWRLLRVCGLGRRGLVLLRGVALVPPHCESAARAPIADASAHWPWG